MSMQAMTFAMTLPVDASGQRLLLFCIAHHVSNETGSTIVGQKRLSDEARVSVRSVRRYLAELEDAGIVKCTPRRRDNGSQTTDQVELVGFLEWLNVIENGGVIPSRKRAKPVDEPADNLAGGNPDLAGGGGHLLSGGGGHCCPTLNQVLNQESLTTSAQARAKDSNSDLEKAGQPRRARPAFDLTPVDVQWEPWVEHLRKIGEHDLADRALSAGKMTVFEKWPRGNDDFILPFVAKQPKDITARIIGEGVAK